MNGVCGLQKGKVEVEEKAAAGFTKTLTAAATHQTVGWTATVSPSHTNSFALSIRLALQLSTISCGFLTLSRVPEFLRYLPPFDAQLYKYPGSARARASALSPLTTTHPGGFRLSQSFSSTHRVQGRCRTTRYVNGYLVFESVATNRRL